MGFSTAGPRHFVPGVGTGENFDGAADGDLCLVFALGFAGAACALTAAVCGAILAMQVVRLAKSSPADRRPAHRAALICLVQSHPFHKRRDRGDLTCGTVPSPSS
jgi:hypothetical protein